MSEYQYFEFQAIDRPLTAKEREYISSLSSRTEATSHQAIFTYSWSDFRANELDILAKYFDALLYLSNWGTARLAFRFPTNAVNLELLSQYTYLDSIEITKHGDKVIFDMLLNDEDGFGWIEGEGYLSKMIELRADIMRGDMRAPYLVWLKIASMEAEYLESDEDLTEPPVPPNLQKMSHALHTLVDFFQIDENLVKVAAENSVNYDKPSTDFDNTLAKLHLSEKDTYLKRVAQGENIQFELMNRLKELDKQTEEPTTQSERRTINALNQRAEAIHEEQIRQKRIAAERKRNQHLDSYLNKIPQTWDTVFFLIDEKRTKAYEEAISYLVDLRDLAKRDGWEADFLEKTDRIYEDYPTLRGLHSRLEEKGFSKS